MPKRIRPHVNPLSIRKQHSFKGFGNNKPIIIDVGACKGEFSAALLEKFGNKKNFLLFEIRQPLFQKLQEQFKDYDNVMVFDGDAGLNFRAILEPCQVQGATIEEIFINFPDPWPKAKYHKRRFINEKFLKECAEYLDERTTFIFQTDQGQLFNDTIEIVEASTFNRIEYFDESPYDIPTDWEEAKIREGDKIWRMRFTKA